ncbi:hypothetical protein QQF64_023454 [Cirrhinus molitorella]|uniref:Uncharacterized protein n=1 Tax=Cirrhinus molitorella TaxID=172907 RepID=A0ABR3L5H2_9TELE
MKDSDDPVSLRILTVRILIVEIRGQSRFTAADLLSGRKDSGQEDREIVITDEGRKMILVTGPNLHNSVRKISRHKRLNQNLL